MEREARARGETITKAETETAAETVAEESEFPPVTSTQMDIFLIRGYDKFSQYVEDVQLFPLDRTEREAQAD